MERDERHRNDDGAVNADMIAQSMKAEEKNKHRENTRRINRLWLWLGILVLVAILLYWIFSIGLLESLTGVANGN